jgi:hypothetical protein
MTLPGAMERTIVNQNRPKYLDLFASGRPRHRLHHRISGFGLFLFLPFLLGCCSRACLSDSYVRYAPRLPTRSSNWS